MVSRNPSMDGDLAVLTAKEAEAMATGLLSRVRAKEALIVVESTSSASAEVANNDIRNMAGEAGNAAFLTVSLDGHEATAQTSDVTADGIASLVAEVEDLASHHSETGSTGLFLGPPATFTDPPIYFESTLRAGAPTAQKDVMRAAAELVDGAGLIGSGNLSVAAHSLFVLTSTGLKGYTQDTAIDFSMTVRAPEGTASGWAWGGAEDMSRLDVNEIVKRAISIAKRSVNPVAVEPGRYVVVLEPEAVADFVESIAFGATAYMSAEVADSGWSAFSRSGGGNKIGHKLADKRVQLLYDPADPLLPFSPLDRSGHVLRRTMWIEDGTLKNLAYGPQYARSQKREPLLNPLMMARLEVKAQAQTLEEMVASIERGIWVHRLGGVAVMDGRTLLLSGVTRDGTFLIENGKITKAIKNMRFSESPFFVLNKLESVGHPVRGSRRVVCPRLKVHDFEFTSLSDAI